MKLLILADDLTGALDTGIQFAREGIDVCVETGLAGETVFDFESFPVIVAHSASRHLAAPEAFARVQTLAEAGLRAGADLIYKKTDSGLRGRIGAELSAVCKAAGEALWFVPAYPEMDRITRGGIHLCGGVPVSESAFGSDPVDPVRHSRLDDLLAESTTDSAELVPADAWPEKGARISVFDCDASSRMDAILAEGLHRRIRLYAGCAGFAASLARALPFPKTSWPSVPRRKGLFAACGSLHPVSREQIRTAEAAGFEIIAPESADPEKIVLNDPGPFTVLHTGNIVFREMDPRQITAAVQNLIARVILPPLREREDLYCMIIGGDALEGLVRKMKASRLIPVLALPGGAVLSRIETEDGTCPLLTKSGGFGPPDLILRIRDMLCEP